MKKRNMEIKSRSSRLGSKIKEIKIASPNHSGFELAISTLIVIILAVLVLIALILVFTGSFGKFSSTIKNFFVSDVEAIKSACRSACDGNLQYDFCCRERDVNFGTGKEKTNCDDIRLNVECIIECEGAC